MQSRKRLIISILTVIVGTLIVWQFRHSPEWKQFSWSAVWGATRAARGWYIAAAIVLIYVSYVIRAVRWQGLMSPHGRFWPVMSGTAVGFSAISLLGRPGELVRPYFIAKRTGQTFSPQLAVLVIERIFDMAGVVGVVAADVIFDPHLHRLIGGAYEAAFRRGAIIIVAFALGLMGLLYLFHFRADRIIEGMRRRNQARPSAARQRLIHFLETLARGTVGITRASSLAAALLLTIALWVDVSIVVWLVVQAYPGMLPGFSIFSAVLLMGLTAIGAVVQLPAVGGGYQVVTIFGLTHIFGADVAAATSAALLMWLICFYAIVPVGLGVATHQGISFRGIEHEAIAAEIVEERR